MKKILVPTDFSPNAEKALDYAVQLVKKNEGEIFLLHAVESEMMEGDILKVAEKMALKIKNFADNENVRITTKVHNGTTLDAIHHAIREFNIDGVVMGTLGNTALSEKIIGSRTASVIGKSPVPVWVIPLLSEWKIPKKILLAINRFDEKEAQILPVIKMARQFFASVQVTIFTDTDDGYVEDYDEHELKIAAYRDMLKEKYPDVEIHAVHLAGHHFTEHVNNWIANNNIDIMVMLPHKKNIIEKILEGSMTKKMSYAVTIPLLTIPV
jgi:nucleotide-binding universal stress UspA family protein